MRFQSRFKQRGLSTPTVLILLIGSGLTVMSLSFSTGHATSGSGTKVQANLLAESAMYELHDRIRAQMWADGSYPSKISRTSLGSYSARVLSATSSIEHALVNGIIVRRQSWIFEIEGTGTTRNGIGSKMQGRFTATADLGQASRRQLDVMSAPKSGTSQFTPSPISNWVLLK